MRRAGVTVVAGKLSEAGIISQSRGQTTVLDRTALENAACECYAVVNSAMRSLLGYAVDTSAPTSVSASDTDGHQRAGDGVASGVRSRRGSR